MCYLSVLNERMCQVTAAATVNKRILTQTKGMKKITVTSMVTHSETMAATFVLKGIALCTLKLVI